METVQVHEVESGHEITCTTDDGQPMEGISEVSFPLIFSFPCFNTVTFYK